MKPYFNLSISISIVFFILFSCSNEQSSNIKIDDPLYSNPPLYNYDSVGLLHNEDCAYIYQTLTEKKLQGALNCEDSILFYSHSSGIQFFIDTLNLTGDDSTTVSNKFDNSWDYIRSGSYVDTALWFPYVSNDLSENQKDILNQLKTIIDDGVLLNDILEEIDSLEVTADQELNENELPAVKSGISVARYSLNYWYENLDNWYNLFDIQSISKDPINDELLAKDTIKIDVKKAAKSDISGAIGGAIGGAIAGGNVLAGAAAGAAGATAASVVSDILDSLW